MCVSLTQWLIASGSGYTVTISLHSYSNLQHTCVRCNVFGLNGCCDEYRLRDPQCTGIYRCDTFFSFCLVPVGSISFNPPIHCGGPSTDTATQFDSDETIDFVSGAVLGITNPFVLNGISNLWTVYEVSNHLITSHCFAHKLTLNLFTFKWQ